MQSNVRIGQIMCCLRVWSACLGGLCRWHCAKGSTVGCSGECALFHAGPRTRASFRIVPKPTICLCLRIKYLPIRIEGLAQITLPYGREVEKGRGQSPWLQFNMTFALKIQTKKKAKPFAQPNKTLSYPITKQSSKARTVDCPRNQSRKLKRKSKRLTPRHRKKNENYSEIKQIAH